MPRLRQQLPARLSSKLVDVLQLDRNAGEGRVLHATLEALQAQDADAGRGHVAWMRDVARTSIPLLVTALRDAVASGLQATRA